MLSCRSRRLKRECVSGLCCQFCQFWSRCEEDVSNSLRIFLRETHSKWQNKKRLPGSRVWTVGSPSQSSHLKLTACWPSCRYSSYQNVQEQFHFFKHLRLHLWYTVCTWVCRGNTSRTHIGSMQFNLGEFSHKQNKTSACQMFNLKSGQNIQPVFPMLTLFYAEFIWFDRASVTRIKSCTGMWLCIFELTVPSSWSQWVVSWVFI